MTLELMRETTDCEVVAIANACGVTYEQAKAALNLPAKTKKAKPAVELTDAEIAESIDKNIEPTFTKILFQNQEAIN
ncbi:MAG TPA: hypothetical protein PLK58_12550 [Candidatus Rifleibacterium sp.]|nr:hypothetical protein [Candidatus Rifleibacterium sp.]